MKGRLAPFSQLWRARKRGSVHLNETGDLTNVFRECPGARDQLIERIRLRRWQNSGRRAVGRRRGIAAPATQLGRVPFHRVKLGGRFLHELVGVAESLDQRPQFRGQSLVRRLPRIPKRA